MSREKWQTEILARDANQAQTVVSYLSNLLYPSLSLARDREAQFMREGGEFAEKIRKVSREKYLQLQKELSNE